MLRVFWLKGFESLCDVFVLKKQTQIYKKEYMKLIITLCESCSTGSLCSVFTVIEVVKATRLLSLAFVAFLPLCPLHMPESLGPSVGMNVFVSSNCETVREMTCF